MTPRPRWLRIRGDITPEIRASADILQRYQAPTVCLVAACPNTRVCFSRRVATFLILGPTCTRACRFCSVEHGRPSAVDADEARRIVAAAGELGLRRVVVTSVTRDDLPDGGASNFAGLTRTLKKSTDCEIELLVPDFQGSSAALHQILDAGPDILTHNLDTVPRLFAKVRPQANYHLSLELLRRAAETGVTTKSGLMLGLGETPAEVTGVLKELYAVGCVSLTLGQYLAPSPRHWPVRRYLPPSEFAKLEATARAIGFKNVNSGPLVRSSYKA